MRKRARLLFFLAVVLFSVAPLAIASRTMMSSVGLRIQSELQAMRADVTRARQQLFVLQSFAGELSISSELREVVEPFSGEHAQWQSPIARTRLRLMDALSKRDSILPSIQSLSVERLERDHFRSSSKERSFDTERLWLSANVNNVASGLSVLAWLEDVVSPYPLLAHGCGFKRGIDEKMNSIDMRCLLSLEAWTLPAVKYEVKHRPDIALSASSDSHATINKETISVDHWRILNTVVPGDSALELDSSISRSRHVDASKDQPVPQGVITGPLGTLLLHGG